MSLKNIFIPVLCALLCLLCKAGAETPGGWDEVPSSAWMKHIDGKIPLSAVNIPGTHNSGARFFSMFASPFAKCQDMSIADQLAAGIRILDIRLAHDSSLDEPFVVCHGSVRCYTDGNMGRYLYFSDVLSDVYAFLAANPSETVVMSIKEEQSSTNRDATFEKHLYTYIGKAGDNPSTSKPYWYDENRNPALDEVRGKIVLLRRYAARDETKPNGLDFRAWANKTDENAYGITIQDAYKQDGNAKWKLLVNTFTLAGSPNTRAQDFIINYASANKGISGTPRSIADDINSRLGKYKWASPARYGWLMLDFADKTLPRIFFSTNPKN